MQISFSIQAVEDCSDAISLAMDSKRTELEGGPPEWLGQAFLKRADLLEQLEYMEGSLGDYRASSSLLPGNKQVSLLFWPSTLFK
jgi:hypothetical protein